MAVEVITFDANIDPFMQKMRAMGLAIDRNRRVSAQVAKQTSQQTIKARKQVGETEQQVSKAVSRAIKEMNALEQKQAKEKERSAKKLQALAMKEIQLRKQMAANTEKTVARQVNAIERLRKEENRRNAQTDVLGKKQKTMNFLMREGAFAVDDFAQVVGTQGLAGGLRAAGNNLSFMATALHPLAGALVGLGVAGATVAIGQLGRSAEEVLTPMERLRQLATNSKDSMDAYAKAIKRAQGNIDDLTQSEEARRRADLSEAQQADIAELEEKRAKAVSDLERSRTQIMRGRAARGGFMEGLELAGRAILVGVKSVGTARVDRELLKTTREQEMITQEMIRKESLRQIRIIDKQISETRKKQAEETGAFERDQIGKQADELVKENRKSIEQRAVDLRRQGLQGNALKKRLTSDLEAELLSVGPQQPGFIARVTREALGGIPGETELGLMARKAGIEEQIRDIEQQQNVLRGQKVGPRVPDFEERRIGKEIQRLEAEQADLRQKMSSIASELKTQTGLLTNIADQGGQNVPKINAQNVKPVPAGNP